MDLRRQRQLNQDAVDLAVGIEPVHERQDLFLRRRRRQRVVEGAHPGLERLARLAADIDLACRIVADEHDREPGPHMRRVESRDRRGDAGAEPLGDRRAVDDPRRHGAQIRATPTLPKISKMRLRRKYKKQDQDDRRDVDAAEVRQDAADRPQRRLGHPVEEVGDLRHDRVARVHDVEGDEPAQDRARDEQPDIERDHRVDEPQQGAHAKPILGPAPAGITIDRGGPAA